MSEELINKVNKKIKLDSNYFSDIQKRLLDEFDDYIKVIHYVEYISDN